MRKAVTAGLLLLCAAQAHADFYRYLDGDGVESFTNTPTDKKAVRVLKEKKSVPAPYAAIPGTGGTLPVHGNITSGVGWRHDPIDGTARHHEGVDIAVTSGTPVKAIAAGKVTFSGVRGGYGNLVVIEHADGLTSLYGHNSSLTAAVGAQVAAGQVISYSGASGRCTGPHLHFELWRSGSNITASYLKGGEGIPDQDGGIRSYLHADGSIVFTNY